MRPTAYIAPGEKTSPRFCTAFAEGCGGGDVQVGGPLRGGAVALWGSPSLWPLLEQARAEGRTFYYGDKAYFGRGEYLRITRNRLQHDGGGDADGERFEQLGIALQPMRQGGEHIVICPNGEIQHQLTGAGIDYWIGSVIATLRRYTDRPVHVRYRSRRGTSPLSNDLQGAWALVAWSSNAAVEAIVAGVPVFVQSEDAAAFRMGTPDLSHIETPVLPSDEERARFCRVLAANQWTLDEIRNGDAWATLRGAA